MVREKYRYVVFRLECTTGRRGPVSQKDIENAVRDYANRLLDDWEYAYSIPKLRVVEFYPSISLGIIKVPLSGYSSLKKVLPLIRAVGVSGCRISHAKTSGIIKKAKQWMLHHTKK